MGVKLMDISILVVVGYSSRGVNNLEQTEIERLSSAGIFPHMDDKVKLGFHSNDGPEEMNRNIVLLHIHLQIIGVCSVSLFKCFSSKPK